MHDKKLTMGTRGYVGSMFRGQVGMNVPLHESKHRRDALSSSMSRVYLSIPTQPKIIFGRAMLGPAHVDPPSPLMREHLGLRVIRLSFRGAEADMREYYTAKGTMYSLYIGDDHASID